jgi:hypothetical protein
MGKLCPASDINPQVAEYRGLASEAMDNVAVYNARAQWFECSGNKKLAEDYRLLSQKALQRAQSYKQMSDLADENLKRLRFETLGKPNKGKSE